MRISRRPVAVFVTAALVAFVLLMVLGMSGVVMPRLLIDSPSEPITIDGVAHHRVMIHNNAPTPVRIRAVRPVDVGAGCEEPEVMIGSATPFEILTSVQTAQDSVELGAFTPIRLGSGEGVVVYWEAAPGSDDAVEVVASGRSGLRRTIRSPNVDRRSPGC